MAQGQRAQKETKEKKKKAPNARSYFRSPLRRGYAAYIYIVFLMFSGCYAEGYAAYIYIAFSKIPLRRGYAAYIYIVILV